MKNKANKKGFTIMEMLIVVAIIAVLAAILIPTFNGALVKSKEAADVANIRAGYAELQVKMLTDNETVPTTEGDFLDKYVDATLNYNGVDSAADKLTYTYDATNKTATIKYEPTKINDEKAYEWKVENPNIA